MRPLPAFLICTFLSISFISYGRKLPDPDRKITSSDFNIASYPSIDPSAKAFFIFDHGVSQYKYDNNNGMYASKPPGVLQSYKYKFTHNMRIFVADNEVLNDTAFNILLIGRFYSDIYSLVPEIEISVYKKLKGKIITETLDETISLSNEGGKIFIQGKQLKPFCSSGCILDIRFSKNLALNYFQDWVFGNQYMPVILSRYETIIPGKISRFEIVGNKDLLDIDKSSHNTGEKIPVMDSPTIPPLLEGFTYQPYQFNFLTHSETWYHIFMTVAYDHRTMQMNNIQTGRDLNKVTYKF